MVSEKKKPSRIAALDFTKGSLVLLMVFYHWLNYFVGPDLDYRYLRFLTPSFIFVTGFLIAQVYLSRRDDARTNPAVRLFVRGAKLLGVFLVLNLVRSVVLPILAGTRVDSSEQLKPENLWSIWVLGNVPITSSKLVAFYILIPICYLLLLSGCLAFSHRVFQYTFHVAFTIGLSGVAFLALRDARSYNLEFLTIGLLGVLLGSFPIEAIDRFVARPVALVVGYCGYLAAITTWNVPFLLLMFGVCLSVGAIYYLGVRQVGPPILRSHLILLGHHSLFAYVMQIAILQVLSAVLRRVDLGAIETAVSFVLAFGLTAMAVEFLDLAKGRFSVVNRAYKLVFG